MGNPNRPNGGILQRFPGLHIPVLDIRTDGSTPVDTPYVTTDIVWEYDAAGDFPLHPTNLLAVLNSVWSGSYLHGDYYQADINGPRAWPDATVGNITYITLEPPHLPLLMPLYDLGFPTALLDLVEPALTVMIDWGYDRSISPGTPTRARLMPTTNPVTAAADLVDAVRAGVHSFRQDLGGATPASPTLAARPDPCRVPRAAIPTPATRPALEALSAPTGGRPHRLERKSRVGALSETGRTPVRPGRQWSPER